MLDKNKRGPFPRSAQCWQRVRTPRGGVEEPHTSAPSISGDGGGQRDRRYWLYYCMNDTLTPHNKTFVLIQWQAFDDFSKLWCFDVLLSCTHAYVIHPLDCMTTVHGVVWGQPEVPLLLGSLLKGYLYRPRGFSSVLKSITCMCNNRF